MITSDEVIAWGPTEDNVDPRVILQAIQIAEDRFIRPALCKDFYNDFRSKKNVVVTDINKAFLESEFTGSVTLEVGEIVNAIEQVDNPHYVELWNEHLWKLIAECVVYIATPTNFSKFTASGEMVNNPRSISISNEGSSSATVSLKELQFKLDKLLMDRIDPLMQAMHEYICDNLGNFPLYNCKKCDSRTRGASYARKTPWVHMYHDKKSNCNDCDHDNYQL